VSICTDEEKSPNGVADLTAVCTGLFLCSWLTMLRKKLPKQGFAFQLYTQGKALPLENHALLFCSLASALCLSISVSLSMCLSFKSVLCLECFIGRH
jgi:hypothetical protein